MDALKFLQDEKIISPDGSQFIISFSDDREDIDLVDLLQNFLDKADLEKPHFMEIFRNQSKLAELYDMFPAEMREQYGTTKRDFVEKSIAFSEKDINDIFYGMAISLGSIAKLGYRLL